MSIKNFLEKHLSITVIYILGLLISIALIVISVLFHVDKGSLFANIGCGVLSAVLIGALVEMINKRENNKKKNIYIKVVLQPLFYEINSVLGLIIWLQERLEDDDFNWDMEVEEFYSLPVSLAMDVKYGGPTLLTYEEAKKILNGSVGTIYSTVFDEESNYDYEKVNKMFNYLSYPFKKLQKEIDTISGEKVALDIGNFVDIEDIDEIRTTFKMIVTTTKPIKGLKKYYGTSVEMFLRINDMLRKKYSFECNVPVGYSLKYIFD